MAVKTDLAMAALPDSFVRQSLETGELVEVLPDAPITPMPLWILWPERSFEAPRLRHFIDHLMAHFKASR